MSQGQFPCVKVYKTGHCQKQCPVLYCDCNCFIPSQLQASYRQRSMQDRLRQWDHYLAAERILTVSAENAKTYGIVV